MRTPFEEICRMLSVQTGSARDYLLKAEMPITGGVLYTVEHVQAGPFDFQSSFAVIAYDDGQVYCQWYWVDRIPRNEGEIALYDWNIPGVQEKVPLVNGLPRDKHYASHFKKTPVEAEPVLPAHSKGPLPPTPPPEHEEPFVPYGAEMYRNPPIPAGYAHTSGNWAEGYVIRCLSDGSEFVWVPVGALPAVNASGVRFAARGYGYSGAPVDQAGSGLETQAESVKKYGGFYISRFTASKSEGDAPVFNGKFPWTYLNQREAAERAGQVEQQAGLKSHLPYAAEMDSLFCWLLTDGLISRKNIEDAAAIRDNKNPNREELRAGLDERCLRGVYGVCGCVDEWTQESVDASYLNLKGCGGSCTWPMATGCYYRPYACYTYTGFRAALWIK